MIKISGFIAKHISWNNFVNITPIYLLLGVLIATSCNISINYWLISLIITPLIGLLIRRKTKNAIWIIALIWLILMGGWCAKNHLQNNQTITLSKPYRFVQMNAEIESVEAISLGKYRLLVKNTTSQSFAPQDQNVRLRLSARITKSPPLMGEIITFRANIFPPSRPAISGGADFARYFYVKNIGGVGYIMGNIRNNINITPVFKKDNFWQPLLQIISNWRVSLDNVIVQNIAPPQTGIAIALITGGRAAIPADINQAMQISGITHILSISGLHMSMVCGLLYFGLRLLLASIAPLALHFPIKQYCAFVALISGAVYLALADFPIPAIRAYVMIALIFAGIIFNREADTLRSLVLAAAGLLIYNPLTALDVGFQLSFVATYALIVAYRRIAKLNALIRQKGFGVLSRGLIYVGNIVISSVVAGLATAPLVLFHFGIFSSYSVLTNVMVLPILSFMVMPALIFGLALEGIWRGDELLLIANYGLQAVIYCANWVANLPQSSLYLPNMSIFIVILMMIALLVLLHWRNIWACGAAVCTIICLCLLPNAASVPDILVAEDSSAIAVRIAPEKWLLLRGSPSNFFVKQWQQITKGEYVSYAQAKKAGQTYGFLCDKQGCDGVFEGQKLRTRYDYRSNAPLCLPETEISVASFYTKKSYFPKGQCAHAKVKIERDMLERLGSFTVSFSPNIKGKHSAKLWNACQHHSPAIWLRCRI